MTSYILLNLNARLTKTNLQGGSKLVCQTSGVDYSPKNNAKIIIKIDFSKFYLKTSQNWGCKNCCGRIWL